MELRLCCVVCVCATYVLCAHAPPCLTVHACLKKFRSQAALCLLFWSPFLPVRGVSAPPRSRFSPVSNLLTPAPPHAHVHRLAMAIKEGDKFPMDSTFQIKGDAGPAVSPSDPLNYDTIPTTQCRRCSHPRAPPLRFPVKCCFLYGQYSSVATMQPLGHQDDIL